MKKALTFGLLILSVAAFAQFPMIKQWDKRFGGTGAEVPEGIYNLKNGGFILFGNTNSNPSGDVIDVTRGGFDGWVVKVDSLGQVQWNRRYGGLATDAIKSVVGTKDGGYLLGGSSTSNADGDKSQPSWAASTDYWVIKVDSVGNKQWDKRFGSIGYDLLEKVLLTKDGGYILLGTSDGDISGDKTKPKWGTLNGANDIWVIKIDSVGNKLWEGNFGGTNQDYANDIWETPDGGLVILGSYSFGGGNHSSNAIGWTDIWLLKIDSAGNKLWDKNYGTVEWDYPTSMEITSDGGFIILGYTYGSGSYENDYWLIKTDAQGNKQWDKFYGATGGYEKSTEVRQTGDGGFLLSGYSEADSSKDKSENNYGGLRQMWLVKTDQQGNKQWDKTIFSGNISNTTNIALSVTKDQGFVLLTDVNFGKVGYKTQDNWSPTFKDYWMIKFGIAPEPTLPVIASFGSPDTLNCNKFCVNFLNASQNANSYKWSFPGAFTTNSTSVSPTICYPAAGIYNVKLVATGNGKADSVTQQITIRAKPIVNLGPDTAFCSIKKVTLDAGNPGSTFRWSDNSTNQTFTPPTYGPYSVTVTAPNGCSANDTIIMLSVAQPYVYLGPNLVVCYSDSIFIKPASTSPLYTYRWQDNSTDSIYKVTQSGVYSVTATDKNQCYDFDSITVTVKPTSVNLSLNKVICPGDSFLFYGKYYSKQGIYRQTMQNIIGCDSSIYLHLDTSTLNAFFTISTSGSNPQNKSVANQASGNGNISYTWYWGDGTSSSGAIPTHTYSTPGDYKICLEISDGTGCTDRYCDSVKNCSLINVVTFPTSMTELVNTSGISIYPNPASSILTIVAKNEQDILITNIFGEVLYQEKSINGRKEIDISHLPSGMYFVNNRKFVKE